MLRTSLLLPEILREYSDRSFGSPLPTIDASIGSDATRWYWWKLGITQRASKLPASDTTSIIMARTPKTGFPYGRRLSKETDRETIRLLKVLPGRGTEPLCCELQYACLRDQHDFEAISYCWGGQNPTQEIQCDGIPLQITENLNAALKAFRRENASILLWADAISINQQDNEEKNSQVPLMRKIYEKASVVQIWLGEDTPAEDCKRAFHLLDKLKQLCTTRGWNLDIGKLIRTRTLEKHGLPDVTDPAWRSLSNLIDRPWFGRAWIIQEVVVACNANLHCGSSSMTWPDFCIGFLFGIDTSFLTLYRPDILSNELAFQHLLQIILTYRYCVNHALDDVDFATLLESHRNTGATDPRDKVYALIGLAGAIEVQNPMIVPNYHLPVADVYIQVAKAVLEGSMTLDLLGVSRVKPKSSIGDLPSWVPDWSAGDFANSLCFKNTRGEYFLDFNAANTSATPKHVIVNDQTLELSGHVFDRVAKVGRLLDPYPEQYLSDHLVVKPLSSVVNGYITVYPHWQDIAGCKSGRPYPNGDDVLDAYIHTLFLSSFPDGHSFHEVKASLLSSKTRRVDRIYSKIDGPLFRRFLAWVDSHFTTRALVQLKSKPKAPLVGGNTISTMIARLMHRKMILTSKGYIGLAPRLTEKNDCIAIVKGGRVPLIIRLKGGDEWELIGDCYIHGIMNGEAFDETKCEKIKIV